MQKGEADVKRKVMLIRVEVNPEAIEQIEDLADQEGRSKQRQMGMLLESSARVIRMPPQSKIDAAEFINPPKLAVA